MTITDTFVPGGHRFTLVTPLSKNGGSINVVMPVLASGLSYRDVAHLVNGPPEKIEEPAIIREKVVAGAGRYVSTPIPISTDTSSISLAVVKTEMGEALGDNASLILLHEHRGGVGPIRQRKTRPRFSRLSARDSSSYRKGVNSSDEETSPYAQRYSKKLYRSKRVYWYRWAGTNILENPPPVPEDLTPIPGRALFVYHRVGYREPQIWQRSKEEENSWKIIHLGDKQVINGNNYVLTLTTQGDPSWLALSTAEKKAQKAKRMKIKQESCPSQSSSGLSEL